MGTTSADSLGDAGIGGAFIRTFVAFGAPRAANQFINHATPGR
ncbi:hypothetical protein [Mycobacterium colombiense]|nr:hypothetical protein [Mycobacterium colombiense]